MQWESNRLGALNKYENDSNSRKGYFCSPYKSRFLSQIVYFAQLLQQNVMPGFQTHVWLGMNRLCESSGHLRKSSKIFGNHYGNLRIIFRILAHVELRKNWNFNQSITLFMCQIFYTKVFQSISVLNEYENISHQTPTTGYLPRPRYGICQTTMSLHVSLAGFHFVGR